MNYYHLSAGILTIVLGLAHSVLGEHLIFKYKREKGKIIPTKHSKELPVGQLRIIWASWHVATFLAWGIGATLIHIAIATEPEQPRVSFFTAAITYAISAVGLCVLLATKGKHPGWVVSFVIVILLILS